MLPGIERREIRSLSYKKKKPDDGKRFQRLEVFPVGEKGGCGGGGTDLQILGFQMGVEEVQKTL